MVLRFNIWAAASRNRGEWVCVYFISRHLTVSARCNVSAQGGKSKKNSNAGIYCQCKRTRFV